MSQTPTPSKRCPWPGIDDREYARYHDKEWGVPLTDDQKLFEKLVLEGFQAGLSWLTILKKRENFRKAFHQFEAHRVARYTQADIARLMS
ncbi:MAG: DNA-3-methyladenine glycosylase I, partial [Alphaproteobacteria bacterium]|nr:DNA-3-methyladenine glycosylase I [Alphaproteobacteria bacterium]